MPCTRWACLPSGPRRCARVSRPWPRCERASTTSSATSPASRAKPGPTTWAGPCWPSATTPSRTPWTATTAAPAWAGPPSTASAASPATSCWPSAGPCAGHPPRKSRCTWRRSMPRTPKTFSMPSRCCERACATTPAAPPWPATWPSSTPALPLPTRWRFTWIWRRGVRPALTPGVPTSWRFY